MRTNSGSPLAIVLVLRLMRFRRTFSSVNDTVKKKKKKKEKKKNNNMEIGPDARVEHKRACYILDEEDVHVSVL